MEAKADLHLHTVCSDGTLTPRELVLRASRAGLAALSVTDHDTVAALDEAIEVGKALGVEVVSGLELSVSVGDQDVHILGYFFDRTHKALLEYLAFCRTARVKRAERIVEKLNGLKVPLSMEAVLDQARNGSVGRPHIANALLEEGLTDTYHEAFYRYIGYGKPAYERKPQATPREAIELIEAAGGLSFVAHPGYMGEQMLTDIIRDGIDGIEVFHPSHSQERISHYKGIVEQYCLLTSGGSDFHGGKPNDAETLGAYAIPISLLDVMRRRL
jgi:predicted metal-dependent phosphoesterase TrpH